jgi:hypothetical protein
MSAFFLAQISREELVAELAWREVMITMEAAAEDNEPMSQLEAIAEVIDFINDDGYALKDEIIDALNEMKKQL